MEDKLRELLEYVKTDGRICPNPQEWQALWEMLPDKKHVGAGWEPALPLILGAWDTPGMFKVKRLEEHIRYAAGHGTLDEVNNYLRSLATNQWFYG